MRTIAWLTAAVVELLVAGCAGIASAPSQEERQALAPTGKLRVALYVGAPASIVRGPTLDQSLPGALGFHSSPWCIPRQAPSWTA